MKKMKNKPGDIQSTIMVAFSVISTLIMVCMGMMVYWRFSGITQQNIVDNNRKIMDQTVDSIENYLVNMRQVSDAAYYDVIKENDIREQNDSIHKGLNLLYEANKENLRSIAIYNGYGSLMAAEPVVAQKEEPDVTRQGWFMQAKTRMENIHFSTPHVQNLFDDGTCRYYWVISSSRVVELTNGTDTQLGVLLVDMDYSGISRMMERINTSGKGQYFYLCDSNGQIIYHPHQVQLDNGMKKESSKKAARAKESVYEERINGEHREIVVDTIGYTGWKLVCVMPYSIFSNKMLDVKHFVLILILLMAMMLTLINRLVSVRISRPIMKLNNSVTEYEEGKEPEIYIGGSREIRHLGRSIQDSYKQNNALMQKIVWEQTERRKSELEVLQSQINPHFLYNTLDTIVWLVESGMEQDAVDMITSLSVFFRTSLSKGKDIIPLSEEKRHTLSYLEIQQSRYRDIMEFEINIPPELDEVMVPKLTLQPLAENALYHGIKNKRGKGKILIEGFNLGDDMMLRVTDNGQGMTPERLYEVQEAIRTGERAGFGLAAVSERIVLYYGPGYGLKISSTEGEGTVMEVYMAKKINRDNNSR